MSNIFLQIPTKGDPVIINNFRILNDFVKKVAEQNDAILKSTTTTVPAGATVKISSDDKKADYLSLKLIASTGITLTQNHPGSIEDITIAAHVPVTLATNHGLGLSGQTLNMGTPSTCTNVTTNAVTTTTHTHEVTGFLTAVTAHNVLSTTHGDSTAGSATSGDIIYADATPKWTRLAKGDNDDILTLKSGLPSWEPAPAGMVAHELLSASHSDTTASTVARGDIIIGSGATPTWDNLAVGASTTYLNGGTEPNWKIPIAADITIPNGVGTPTYDDMQDFLNMTQASGRLTGGAITASATVGAVDISAMEMMVHTANTLGSPLIYFKKAAVSDLALTVDPGVNYIWATYTSAGGGTITYSSNAARPTADYNVFVIGRAIRIGSDVEVLTTGQNIYNQYGRMQDRLLVKYGSMDRATGAVVSAHATPLRLQCTGSKWYFGNTLIDLSAVAPNTFQVWYKTGGGAWTESSALTLFSEVFDGGTSKVYETYQNGTSLAALGANKYGVYWVFMCPEGGLYVVLGTATYANVGAAQAATVPASLPDYCVDWARLIGRVIIKNSDSAFYSVESVFSTPFTLSAAVDHASLANLTAANSHPQAAITGLTTADSPVFVTVKLSGLTDDYIPYHVDDATGLANGPTKTNVDSAVSLKHAAVTFGNYATRILTLTGQAITTPATNANVVYAGPTSGVAAEADFRSIVLDDLPTITAAKGGTGQTSYTIGDLLYASASNALSKLADVAVLSYLASGGVGAAPSWLATNTAPVVEIAAAEPAGRDNGHLWYDSDAIHTGWTIDILQVEIFSGG